MKIDVVDWIRWVEDETPVIVITWCRNIHTKQRQMRLQKAIVTQITIEKGVRPAMTVVYSDYKDWKPLSLIGPTMCARADSRYVLGPVKCLKGLKQSDNYRDMIDEANRLVKTYREAKMNKLMSQFLRRLSKV